MLEKRRYKVENFEADNYGALQTMPKNDRNCISLKLKQKIKLTHDTFIFRFDIPNNKEFGLHIGGHVFFKADIESENETTKEIEKKETIRKYTPISMVRERG